MADNIVKFKPRRPLKEPRKLSRLQKKLVIIAVIGAVFGIIYLKNWLTGQA